MEKTPTLFGEALGGLKHEAPVSNGRLTLLPFTCRRPGTTRYVLLEKAIRRGRLTVTEVSDGGAVPYLKAQNMGPWPVLIFDGEELIGAKQNRIVNTTILVGVGETILPVSCVEQGRWSHRSRAFAAGQWASHLRLRREKEAQVRNALAFAPEAAPGMARPQTERARDYQADQGAVWRECRSTSRQTAPWSAWESLARSVCGLARPGAAPGAKAKAFRTWLPSHDGGAGDWPTGRPRRPGCGGSSGPARRRRPEGSSPPHPPIWSCSRCGSAWRL